MNKEYQKRFNMCMNDILAHRENLIEEWAYRSYCDEFDVWDFM